MHSATYFLKEKKLEIKNQILTIWEDMIVLSQMFLS